MEYSGSFNTFYTNFTTRLSELEQEKKYSLYLKELAKLFPMAQKFFAKDSEKILLVTNLVHLMQRLKKEVTQNQLSKISAYQILEDKLIMKYKSGESKEYPLISIPDFLNNSGIRSDHPHFLFLISFLMLPSNFDAIQLFNKN